MNEIIEKLEYLRRNDTEFEVFGSSKHRYKLNAPLSDADFKAIEKKYGCVFPDEYRYFITEIGNGGAGPFYGFFPIEIQDKNHGYGPWESGYLITDLSKPFPFTQAWNLDDSFWSKQPDPDESTPEEEEDEMWERWDKMLEENYWCVNDGAIPICHRGCAIRDWLIVSGQERGNVWIDYRADYDGLAPVSTENAKRVSLLDWYSIWLEESIKELDNA